MKSLEEIWHQVPPNYYQKGIKNSLLQMFWHTNKLNIVLKTIKNKTQNPKSILDVGCASGWFLNEISKKFPRARCVGLDVYKNAIDYGKRKYKDLILLNKDAHKIPYKSNTFDVVICTEVLEHVQDPKLVIKEIKRVLKKEGIGIIEMDSGNLLFRVVWYWWTNLRKGIWQDAHIQSFDSKKLENMLKRNGLKIIEKQSFNFSMAVLFAVSK